MPPKWVRKSISAVAALVLTAVIGYACIFNTFTLTRIVLPLLSSLSGIEMRAAHLDYVPFTGKAAGKKICIGPEKYPWFRAEEAHFTFDISAALRGKYRFYDVWIRGGDIQVTQYPNGWSFGPPPVPVSASVQEREKNSSSPLPASENSEEDETVFELRRITLQESIFKVRWGERRKHGSFIMSAVNGYAERFKKGRPFNGRLSGNVQLNGIKDNRIDKGFISMSWHNQLLDDLMPERSVWKLRLEKLSGRVNGEPFENAALSLDFNGRQKDGLFVADQLHLTQTHNGEVRSILDFKGDLSPQFGAARGEVRNGKLSPELTALACEFFYNIDPGMVWVNYEGTFLWDQQQFNATGKFNIRREGDMYIDRQQLAFPPMDFDGRYDFRVHRESREIDLAEFRLRAVSQERQIASIQLRKPLKYRWKEGNETQAAAQRAVFDLNCDALDIHLLKFLIPQNEQFSLNSGQLFSNITVTCHSDLRAVDVAGNCRLANLNWTQEQTCRQLEDIRLDFRGTLDKTFSFKLPRCRLEVRDQNVKFGELHLNGNWDHPAGKSFFTASLQHVSPELLAWYQQKPLPPELKALQPGTASLKFKGYFDAEGNIVNISGLAAQHSFGEKLKLSLAAAPFTCDLSEGKMLENVNFKLSADGSCTALADWARLCTLPVPAGGTLSGTVQGNLARDFSWMLFDGTCAVKALSALPPQEKIANIDAEGRFSCYFHHMEQLEFKKADLYIRRQGHPALRIECPGMLDFLSGSYLGNWKLRYLNERFTDLFFPMKGTELDLNGNLQLTLTEDFKKQKLVTSLECSKLQTPGQAAVSGSVSGVLENSARQLQIQRASLDLAQGENVLLQLSATGKFPRSGGGNDAEVTVQTRQLDLPRLMAVVETFLPDAPPKPTAKKRLPAGRPPKPELDLSRYPGIIDLELNDCLITEGLKTGLKSRFLINRNKLTAETFSLRAEESLFSGSFTLQNETDGISLQGNIKGGETPLAFRPLAELLLGHDMNGLQGTVSNLDSRIFCLNDGGEGGWLNAVNGSFSADFQNLRIPGNLSSGPFGRLLLFPVDVVAQLVGYLPNDLENWKARFMPGTGKHYSSVGILHFDQGNVRLRSDYGKITVDFCRFLGPSVKRLSFEGNVELRDQQSVELKARVSAVGGQILIPISGTLSDPELNWRTLATDPAAEALRKIRNLKLVGMEHQHHEKDEPLIVVSDLPGGSFLKKAHDFFIGLFQ